MYNAKVAWKKYYKKHAKRLRLKRKTYYLLNKDKERTYGKEYNRTHKLERKLYRLKNLVNIKKQNKKYRKLHKKDKHNYYIKNRYKILKRQKEYYLKNKKEMLEKNKNRNKLNRKKITKYFNNKLKIDINFKLAHYLRSQIRKKLRNNSKSKHTTKLLGCSVEFLKQHLSSKFTSGMTWDNYGKWHIDHIRPCASFDLIKPSEQRKCFHYTNLQPLWAKDNLSKGVKHDKFN